MKGNIVTENENYFRKYNFPSSETSTKEIFLKTQPINRSFIKRFCCCFISIYFVVYLGLEYTKTYFAIGTTIMDNKLIYDIVIVPGGGIKPDHSPQPWVCARLDYAANLYIQGKTKYIMVLSRGTPHKAPPRTKEDIPVDEAMSSADYLISQHQIEPKYIFLERWSFDTLGNAFAALTMHVLPRKLKKIHLVTSDWHLPRTREIFDTVFACSGASDIELTYAAAQNIGLSDNETELRLKRELESLETFRTMTKPMLKDMDSLHKFIFEEHGCYKAGSHLKPMSSGSVSGSY